MSEKYLKGWFAGLLGCVLFVGLCFLWLDLPVARFFEHSSRHVQAYGLPSVAILTGELLVVTILAMIRILRGRLPEAAKVLMIAILTSIMAFTANDYVLKIIFGVQQPSEFLFQSARHGFHFLTGSQMSSFPSGHMALAGGFAGVWVRLYPATAWALCGLLAAGMGLLVAGDWHFLSDVVAGTFLGVTAGLMAGSLWLAHNARRES